MASDKSLAAEIEAVLRKHGVEKYDASGDGNLIDLTPQVAAEIAALQSRAFEDGARWMRERVQNRISDRAYLMEHGNEQQAVLRVAQDVEALPLQPEGERSDA